MKRVLAATLLAWLMFTGLVMPHAETSPKRHEIFNEVTELLKTGEAAALQRAAELAGEYERHFGKDCLIQRVATFRRWTPEQRKNWETGTKLHLDAIQAFSEGRVEEAEAVFGELIDRFRELDDPRGIARALNAHGTMAIVSGNSLAGLEWMDRAAIEARRACDRLEIGAIALNRSYALDELGEIDTSIAALEEALEIAREVEDVELEIAATVNLGAAHEGQGRLDEARAAAERAAELSAKSGDLEGAAMARLNLGLLDATAGERDRQRANLLEAVKLAESGQLAVLSASIYTSLSGLDLSQGNWDAARDSLDRARAHLVGVSHPIAHADLRLSESRLLATRGQYADMLPIIEEAERFVSGLDASEIKINVAELKAVAHYHLGNYFAAEAALRRALDVAIATGKAIYEAYIRNMLGFLLFHAGRTAESLAELTKSMEIHEAFGSPRVGNDLDQIGLLRFLSGDVSGARTALEASIEKNREKQQPGEEKEALIDLARVEFAAGAARRAVGLAHLAEARLIADRLEDPISIQNIESVLAEVALDDGDTSTARKALARAAVAKSQTDSIEYEWKLRFLGGYLNEREGKHAAAIEEYRGAIAFVDQRRERMSKPVGRAAAMDDRFAPYRRLAALLRSMGQFESSWEVARSGKARTFVDSLVADPIGLLSDETLGSMLLGTSAELLPVSNPVTDSRAGTNGVPNRKLQSLLRPRERLLDLYIDGEMLHVFLVDQERIVVRSMPIPADTLDLVAVAGWPGRPGDENRAVTQAWNSAVNRLGRQWFDPLADELRGVDRLLIVPNGVLHDLPFAALEFQGQPLIATFEISVLPAAETIVSRSRAAKGRGLVALGDSTVEPRLAQAAKEAQEIARRTPDGKAFVGAAATEDRFRLSATGADRIHLAAHGRVDRLVPAHSHISLTPDGEHDGRLQADEVAAMNLEASLVVLSGCKTAVEGSIARVNGPADERMGLPRAFLTAGAGSVVGGLWEMDDTAARKVMTLLYDELELKDAAGALSALQRRIVGGNDDDTATAALDHPYYWAGLVAYGAGLRQPRRSTTK